MAKMGFMCGPGHIHIQFNFEQNREKIIEAKVIYHRMVDSALIINIAFILTLLIYQTSVGTG